MANDIAAYDDAVVTDGGERISFEDLSRDHRDQRNSLDDPPVIDEVIDVTPPLRTLNARAPTNLAL